MFDVDQVNGRLRDDKRIKTDSADDLSGLSWRYSVAQCELSKDVQMVPKQYFPVMPMRGRNVRLRKTRTFPVQPAGIMTGMPQQKTFLNSGF